MEGYLGETPIDSLVGTPFENFGPIQWAMKYIEMYGGIDGDHHKTWVLDQVARILKGTDIKVSLAKWSNGFKEYRFKTDSPSFQYISWRRDMLGEYDDENDEYEYSYDEGIAP